MKNPHPSHQSHALNELKHFLSNLSFNQTFLHLIIFRHWLQNQNSRFEGKENKATGEWTIFLCYHDNRQWLQPFPFFHESTQIWDVSFDWFFVLLSISSQWISFNFTDSRSRALPHNHHELLSWGHGNHARLWHYKREKFRKHSQVAEKYRWTCEWRWVWLLIRCN